MSTTPDRTTALDEPISTPDRRVRVFVSSTLQEMAPERIAARDAVLRMRLTPVMFETGARPHQPRRLYRAYLEQSDVFIGIYGRRYGWVGPGESVSGLEDEYALSAEMPKLIYVEDAVDREPRLATLLARIQEDDGASYKHFADAAELADLVVDDLAVLLTERFTRSSLRDPATVTPLPKPLTPIIGRDAEIEDVGRLLTDRMTRLVTVVGPGGIGKTRLALEVARRAAESSDYPDGVWFIDLSSVGAASHFAEAVSGVLGVREEGARSVFDLLVERLQDRSMLLVLDNFEQIRAAAAELSSLLTAAEGVTALVTSRSVLDIRGEQLLQLAPLATPPADGIARLDVVVQSPAVQMLLLRAQRSRPGLTVTAGNAAAFAAVATRLDGIPLALELAGAQLRLLSPAALARRLDDELGRSLEFAKGPVDLPDRQRTLRATLDWSVGLLTDVERELFENLSILSGYWDAAAASAVTSADPDLSTTLTSLVDQSLVQLEDPLLLETDAIALENPVPNDEGVPRFRLLNPLRDYAATRLAASGREPQTADRLAEYVLTLVESAAAGLEGRENTQYGVRIDGELANIRTVIDRAVQDDQAMTVARLVGPLFTFWWSRGLLGTASSFARRAATLPSAAALSPVGAATLTWVQAMGAFSKGEAVDAVPKFEQVLAIATTAGDTRLQGQALLGLGWLRTPSSFAESDELLDRAATLLRVAGDRWALALALSTRGAIALLGGDSSTARTIHLEGLAAADSLDNDHLRAQLVDMLGLDAVAAGDLQEARSRYAAGAALHLKIHDQEGSSYGIGGMSGLALTLNRPEAAARLLGASFAARNRIGVTAWPSTIPFGDALQAALVVALGTERFQAEMEVGRNMRVLEALTFGLAVTAADETSASALLVSWRRYARSGSPAPDAPGLADRLQMAASAPPEHGTRDPEQRATRSLR